MALGLAFSSRQGLVFLICSQLIELQNRTEMRDQTGVPLPSWAATTLLGKVKLLLPKQGLF